MLRLALPLGAFLMMSVAASAQAPPRFYWKSLMGGEAVPVLYQSVSGNSNPFDSAHTIQVDSEFEAEMLVAGYARAFPLFDRAAFAAVLLTMGRLSSDTTVGGMVANDNASGFGDPMFEFGINLIGPPPIRNIPDLLRYEPGFSLDVIADIALPVGEYDSGESLNIGQNRFYGRIGAPIVWQLGPWIPSRRTTVELQPSVWWFTDNDDFQGSTLETDLMFEVEGHLTRDLTESSWGSFDAVWVTGGESTIGGTTGEPVDNIAVGLTFGYQINDSFQLTVGYRSTIDDGDPTDLRMDGFYVSLLNGWHSLIEGMNRLAGD
jgi:hypothetical protein